MIKLGFVFVLLAVFSFANTSIVGTLNAPSGSLSTGVLTLTTPPGVSLLASCAGATVTPYNNTVNISIVNGAPQNLVPIQGNDCLSPSGTFYKVQYRDNAGVITSTSWSIVGPVFNLSDQTFNPPGYNAIQLQGRNISTTAPTNGQVYEWDTATLTWKPATVSGGGSAAGSTGDVQLNGGSGAFGADSGVFTYSSHKLSAPLTIWNAVVEPDAGGMTAAATVTPGTPNGTYYYYVSYVTADGETGLSSAFASVTTGGAFQILVSGIPVSTDTRVTGRRLYRSATSNIGGNSLVLIANTTATTYTDNLPQPANPCGTYSDPCPAQGYPNTTAGLLYYGVRIASVQRGDDGSGPLEFGNTGTAFGWKAGISPYGAGENSFFGAYAGTGVTLGGENSGVGSYSLVELLDGFGNTAMGHWALSTLVHGSENVAVGSYTAANYEGNNGTFVGQNVASYGNTMATGNGVTIVGALSYGGTVNHGTMLSGDNTTGVGFKVFERITTGANNAALGSLSCNKISSGAANLCLGEGAGPTTNQSNGLYINNSESDTPLIGGDFSARTVSFDAAIKEPFVTPPIAPTVALVATGTGNIDNGAHVWLVTFVTAQGNTAPGALSATLTVDGSHKQVDLSDIPVSADARVVSKNIYRTKAGITNCYGTDNPPISETKCFLLANIPNATTTYTDNTADSGLGANPTQDQTAGWTYWGSTLVGKFDSLGFYSPNLVIERNGGLYMDTYAEGQAQRAIVLHGCCAPSAGGNIFVGQNAGGGHNFAALTGGSNTGMGASALQRLTSGAHNTAFGNAACDIVATGQNNICIGNAAGPTTDVSNKLFIDVAITDTPLIGADFMVKSVTINDNTTGRTTIASLATSGAATGKHVVCADGSGTLFVSSTGTDCSN